jgi:hypothetical protein
VRGPRFSALLQKAAASDGDMRVAVFELIGMISTLFCAGNTGARDKKMEVAKVMLTAVIFTEFPFFERTWLQEYIIT